MDATIFWRYSYASYMIFPHCPLLISPFHAELKMVDYLICLVNVRLIVLTCWSNTIKKQRVQFTWATKKMKHVPKGMKIGLPSQVRGHRSRELWRLSRRPEEVEGVAFVLIHSPYKMYRSLHSSAVTHITQLVFRILPFRLVAAIKVLEPLPRKQNHTMRMAMATSMKRMMMMILQVALGCVVSCVLQLLVDYEVRVGERFLFLCTDMFMAYFLLSFYWWWALYLIIYSGQVFRFPGPSNNNYSTCSLLM